MQLIDEIHHGACMGADQEVHDGAIERGIPLVVHPPVNTRWLAESCIAEHELVTVIPAKPYLNRDRDIVSAIEALIAFPLKREADGGGTWYTIGFAQRMGKPVTIIYANGEVEERKRP
jgi:hypothetical protein